MPAKKGLKEVMSQNIIRAKAGINHYCKIFFDNEYPLTAVKQLQWFDNKQGESF